MHKNLFRWIVGSPPVPVGVYWAAAGVCLAYRGSDRHPDVIFVTAGNDAEATGWREAVVRLEAASGLKQKHMAFSVALNADDVFVREMATPEGLDDRQLEHMAIVEAVANLPVPPEEICLDFVRGHKNAQDEIVKLAFCRRERIDEILASAEEVNIPVRVVDRDAQAIHDGILEYRDPVESAIDYPCAILLYMTQRLIICLAETEFEIYPIRMRVSGDEDATATLMGQVASCWTRCKMARALPEENLRQIYLIGVLDGELSEVNGITPVDSVPSLQRIKYKPWMATIMNDKVIPEEVLLIAVGMAVRELV